MKIPERVINIIHEIEEIGEEFAEYEKELYKFLEEKEINTEDEVYDQALEILMRSHNGSYLIKLLREE